WTIARDLRDCLQLVNLLEEERTKMASLLAEFDEFRLISSMFTFCSIFFPCSRASADHLAKGARSRGFLFSV
ncbi:hypothetical protein Bca52824_020028, partial [Brassica carinata]